MYAPMPGGKLRQYSDRKEYVCVPFRLWAQASIRRVVEPCDLLHEHRSVFSEVAAHNWHTATWEILSGGVGVDIVF